MVLVMDDAEPQSISDTILELVLLYDRTPCTERWPVFLRTSKMNLGNQKIKHSSFNLSTSIH